MARRTKGKRGMKVTRRGVTYVTTPWVVSHSKGNLTYNRLNDALVKGKLTKGVMRDRKNFQRRYLIEERVARRLIERAKRGETVFPRRKEYPDVLMLKEGRWKRPRKIAFWSLSHIEKKSGGAVSSKSLQEASLGGRIEGVVQTIHKTPNKRKYYIRREKAKEIIERVKEGKTFVPRKKHEGVVIVGGTTYWSLSEIQERSKGKLNKKTLQGDIVRGRFPEEYLEEDPAEAHGRHLVEESFARKLIKAGKKGKITLLRRENVRPVFISIGGKRKKCWRLEDAEIISKRKLKASTLGNAIRQGRLPRREYSVGTRSYHAIEDSVLRDLMEKAKSTKRPIPRADRATVMLDVRSHGVLEKVPFLSFKTIEELSDGRIRATDLVSSALGRNSAKKPKRGVVRRDPNDARGRYLMKADVAKQMIKDSIKYSVPVYPLRGKTKEPTETRWIAGREYTTEKQRDVILRVERDVPINKRLAAIEDELGALRGEQSRINSRRVTFEGERKDILWKMKRRMEEEGLVDLQEVRRLEKRLERESKGLTRKMVRLSNERSKLEHQLARAV